MKNKFILGIWAFVAAVVLAFGLVPIANVFAKEEYVTIGSIGSELNGIGLYGNGNVAVLLVGISCIATFCAVFLWLSYERKRFAEGEDW